MINIDQLVDASRLYGDDHAERCLEYVEHFFQNAQLSYVQSVYAVGSAVTADYIIGHSDVDIVVVVDDSDLAELLEALRALNARLWTTVFHLCKQRDFPPPDMFFRIRLLAESRLLYGRNMADKLTDISRTTLHSQLTTLVSHRLVLLRSLYCSPAFDRFTPQHTVYYCQKHSLLGLRALQITHGDWDTRREHVIANALHRGDFLSLRSRSLVERFGQALTGCVLPSSDEARRALLYETIALLEEVQAAITL